MAVLSFANIKFADHDLFQRVVRQLNPAKFSSYIVTITSHH